MRMFAQLHFTCWILMDGQLDGFAKATEKELNGTKTQFQFVFLNLNGTEFQFPHTPNEISQLVSQHGQSVGQSAWGSVGQSVQGSVGQSAWAVSWSVSTGVSWSVSTGVRVVDGYQAFRLFILTLTNSTHTKNNRKHRYIENITTNSCSQLP